MTEAKLKKGGNKSASNWPFFLYIFYFANEHISKVNLVVRVELFTVIHALNFPLLISSLLHPLTVYWR